MSERKRRVVPQFFSGPFEPDVILPEQLFVTLRHQPMPEKRLMVAILEDAVNCFQKYHSATTGPLRRTFEDTLAWLMDPHAEWPFSFENVCEVLGLDAGYVRRGLLQWQERERASHMAAIANLQAVQHTVDPAVEWRADLPSQASGD